MDLNDAKEAARDPVPEDGVNTKPPETQEKSKDIVNNKEPDPMKLKTDKKADSVSDLNVAPPSTTTCDAKEAVDVEMATAASTSAKRSRDTGEDDVGNTKEMGIDEPPAKTFPLRRGSLKFKPTIPPDRKPPPANPLP
ncbi:hypothetical protein HPB52_011268 [Rhipicephalus sanguineus]|uniref:Uncharacterized protein n=1 Tax=Rhipicephalus sanguineus TaxID=34632 RepID=A0A9D4Q5P9_RHISA|nr:hypothetical protein HPB52_000225 [Rhipicephalus sanguineus]KAH7968769.1 hypothetical protein HPB52_011268 [Rhipicephalus sanguineus]